MSDRLAISSAFSVLMMAGYVLFSPQAAQVPLGPQTSELQIAEPSSILPQFSSLLPRTN